MVTDAINWWADSTTLLFSTIVNSWLLASFLFVSILYIIASLIIQLRNK